ncbi:MAG: hypothetical protein KF696_05785 [Planctomycetes bacterium]|nr:hypothetical protein [Planctomycetota bacterium]MCW8136397.1 hypothetical protein [Planctomycetota bacterium]
MFLKRNLALAATAVLCLLAAACQPEKTSESEPENVKFASDLLPADTAAPGEMLAIDVKGHSSKIKQGFYVQFDTGDHQAAVAPFHVEAGKAYVMVPPLNTTDTVVTLSLHNMGGKTLDRHPQSLTITPFATELEYSRQLFNAAIGQGLAGLVNLAIESVDELETEGVVPGADATVVRDAMAQQVELFNGIGTYNNNLSDAELAVLQQLLGNSKVLELLAYAGGVPLTSEYGQSSPLYTGWAGAVQSALLKADFASVIIGEIRGVMALLSWAGSALSGVPVIGPYAQQVATWAQGVAASLQTPHDIINSMIPCDIVRITAPYPTMTLYPSSSGTVVAKGRFETETAFNTALFTQTVGQYTQAAATWLTSRLQSAPWARAYGYQLQQIAAQVPQWLINWMTQVGLLQASVVPGSSFVVLTIDNFNLYMAQYRFNIGGILANLLNVPYNVMSAILGVLGFGMGAPIGGYQGVRIGSTAVAYYNPNSDTVWANARGNTTLTYAAPYGRPAGGWWAQWGFYTLKESAANVTLTVQ